MPTAAGSVATQDLRRHVQRRAGHRKLMAASVRAVSRNSKIAQTHYALQREEYVGRFDVAMRDIVLVAVLQRQGDLHEYVQRLAQWQSNRRIILVLVFYWWEKIVFYSLGTRRARGCNPLRQIAAVAIFHDEAQPLRTLLKRIVQFDNVWMAA